MSDSTELDSEIAQLMGLSPETAEAKPDFSDLFEEKQENAEEAGLNKQHFEPITDFLEKPKAFFADKNFYKKVLSGEGEISKKVHSLFTQFLGATDSQDKSMHRNRLIPAYWNLCAGIASRIRRDLPIEKILLLRFGILSPSLISSEQRDLISRIIFDNKLGEPVHYVDEWLLKIAQGSINPSTTDELKKVKQDDDQALLGKIEKRKGQRQAELAVLQSKIQRTDQLEAEFLHKAQAILKHDIRTEYNNLKDCYNPMQKEALSQVSSILRQLTANDRNIAESYSTLESMDRDLDDLSFKSEGVENQGPVNTKTVIGEFNSIRQMAKMCVGRQGNHFPILLKQYMRPDKNNIATRENVINIMSQVEKLDPEIFQRTFKRQTNRIVPYVVILPNYGENGICWEPFERFNRASSRGRIALPLYPKDLQTAVIAALADLRWLVAKEKAQHYWMEEGITGRYYQWFQEAKLRGDVREYFIQDYILWITRESQGTQKLDREIRGLFWRMIPFPPEVKEGLRNRGFVYNELYKKDSNISRSDGY